MIRTESQQNASRVNGAKSHGPVTPEGKAKSSQNGTTHGLFSDSLLLRKESREAWNQLSADLVERFDPVGNVELNIIYQMAVTTWRSQRAINMEAAIIDMEIDVVELTDAPANSPEDEVRIAATAYVKAVGRDKAILELGRQSIRLDNLWMRWHKKLKELQEDRKRTEAAAPAGQPAEPEQAKENSKSEPGVVEISSFQRNMSNDPEPGPSASSPRSPLGSPSPLGNRPDAGK